MPRPKKYRHVCAMPKSMAFGPKQGKENNDPPIIMTVDEYETIRLIDVEGFSQIECALQMQVARTTAQKIYNDAKHKLGDALINGKTILIRGGEYELCNQKKEEDRCAQCRCRRSQYKNDSKNDRRESK